MYQRILPFDANSFIEVSSRLTGEGEQLMLSIRGKKNNTETTVSSVLLNQQQADQLSGFIKDWAPSLLEEMPKMPSQ